MIIKSYFDYMLLFILNINITYCWLLIIQALICMSIPFFIIIIHFLFFIYIFLVYYVSLVYVYFIYYLIFNHSCPCTSFVPSIGNSSKCAECGHTSPHVDPNAFRSPFTIPYSDIISFTFLFFT